MIIAIIQARMGSSRLPGKILLPLALDMTVLQYELARIKQSKLIDKIVVATTVEKADDQVAELLEKMGQEYYRGSQDDVLDRYYEAGLAFGARTGDVVVRLTADCPLIDPEIIDEVIQTYLDHNFDFVSNCLPPYSYPDGMDVEVVSFTNLEKAWREATLPSHREHVTFYFWQNPGHFRIFGVKNKQDLSRFRLTLDYPEDYELIKKIAEYFPATDYHLADVVSYLDNRPELKKLNAHIIHNAGWQAALNKDREYLANNS